MPKVHNAEYIPPGNYSKYDYKGNRRQSGRPGAHAKRRTVDLSFLGKAAPYLQVLKESGIGDLGIVWVPLIAGGMKLLGLSAIGYFGYKAVSKPEEVFSETAKRVGEKLKMSAPFIAGAFGTALLHKYTIPQRYKKFSAVVPVGFAAYSLYRLMVEKTPAEIAKAIAKKYLEAHKKPLLIPGSRLANLEKGFFAEAFIGYEPKKGYTLDIITNNKSDKPKAFVMRMVGAEVVNGKTVGHIKEWMDAEPGDIAPLTKEDKRAGIVLISGGMTGEMLAKSIEGLEKKYGGRYTIKVFFYDKANLTKPFYVTTKIDYKTPVKRKKRMEKERAEKPFHFRI